MPQPASIGASPARSLCSPSSLPWLAQGRDETGRREPLYLDQAGVRFGKSKSAGAIEGRRSEWSRARLKGMARRTFLESFDSGDNYHIRNFLSYSLTIHGLIYYYNYHI